MKTIIIRTISGAVYISIILGSLALNKSLFAGVLMLLNLLALIEFQKFVDKDSKSLLPVFLGISAFAIAHFTLLGMLDTKWIGLLALIPVSALLNALFSKNRHPFKQIGFTFLSLSYITLPLLLLNALNFQTEKAFSVLVACMFIIIWTNDTFAYLSGLAFGRHKLFERISPKKTWEGFFGGIIVSVFAGVFLHRFLDTISLQNWLIITGLVAISSVLGDLIESLFKRHAGLKDSGSIMPGHGGILDRIDSVLLVAPVLYLCLWFIN